MEDYQSAVAWKNLFLALFVPQRGFLLALPAGLLLLWSWRRRLLRGEPGLPAWVEGLVWGALPLVHLHTFLFVSLVVRDVGGRRPPRGGGPAAPSRGRSSRPTWSVWQVTDGFRAASLVGLEAGLDDRARENPLVFLLVNFGLFLPLALVALALAVRERRREELLVLGPALAVFAALFLVRLAPWEWDNTKVMLWCYVAALPPIGTLVLVAARPAVAGGPRRRSALLGGGERPRRVARARAAPRGPGLAEYDGRVPRARGRSRRRPGRDGADLQPPRRPVRAADRRRLRGPPVEPRPRRDGGRARGSRRLMRGEPDWREEARALGASHVFWGARERQAFPGVDAALARRPARPWPRGRGARSTGWTERRDVGEEVPQLLEVRRDAERDHEPDPRLRTAEVAGEDRAHLREPLPAALEAVERGDPALGAAGDDDDRHAGPQRGPDPGEGARRHVPRARPLEDEAAGAAVERGAEEAVVGAGGEDVEVDGGHEPARAAGPGRGREDRGRAPARGRARPPARGRCGRRRAAACAACGRGRRRGSPRRRRRACRGRPSRGGRRSARRR